MSGLTWMRVVTLDHAVARHANDFIWGSERPWFEVLLARHGAKQIVFSESVNRPGSGVILFLSHH